VISFEQTVSVLDALPDPAFLISRSGQYLAAFGGKDCRYYPDAKQLVGHNISELVDTATAQWAIEQVNLALDSQKLLIVEYEIGKSDFKGLSGAGPDESIWFEGRIQPLGFKANDESVVLWVASNISQRHALEVKLREMSDTDQLTGLYNRRKLENELERHFELFRRHAVPTSVLMFDLDNLKIINDALGHFAGDELILAVADLCKSELRTNDVACRFGGDEFVVALPNIEREEAVRLAERLHGCFERSLRRFAVDQVTATVSMGVTAMLPADASYLDTLSRADIALYAAKNEGKNRISAL
jgi:diguanylate cyclase (GGDEF)-like protein